jgi:hypothetical protein
MSVLVRTSTGKQMTISQEDYESLKNKGFKMTVISNEIKIEEIKTQKYDSQIYTAICGKYPIKRNDITCFKGEKIFTRPVMEAKRYKILPHLFFDNEVTIWIDGNIFPKVNNDRLINIFLGDNDMALFKHPYRQHTFDEFKELSRDARFKDKWLQNNLKEQSKYYEKKGLAGQQLYECNFMIRRNNAKVNQLMNAWWAEICRWQWRDQVSLPYVIWKYGKDIKIKGIEGNIRHNKYIKHIEQNK